MKQQYFMRLIATALITLILSSAIAFANPSNKWRLQFSGSAHSDGVIAIEVLPVGSDPIVVEISIAAGTSENHVAKTVVEKLRSSLPSEAFHIERDDGEDVLIKKHHKAASFDLKIVSNTVKNVRIRPDRE